MPRSSDKPAWTPPSAAGSDRCLELAAEVARISGERGSWRRRLEWVRDVLTRDHGARDPEVLAYLGVFLKLVASGAIPGHEDGGHYRPSHHAELGLEIEHVLLADVRPENRSLVRGILRWLPSHDLPFRRAEPLTRIRDIAHRNDIPQPLKNEIKGTLQNKLHRSAGPEDLQTSADLLARITSPEAQFPESFVREFRLFHAELEAFFNAGSVEQDLRELLPKLPAVDASAAEDFLALHRLPLDSPDRIDRELVAITRLRRALAPAFADGEAPLGQKMRLADLKLDERAFVLVSMRVNRLEAKTDATQVDALLDVMAEVAAQLAISGVEPEFMQALAVRPEKHEGIPGGREEDMRLARARFETARIVLGRYADRVLGGCARFAAELGRRLAMPAQVTGQFAEREIRGSLAFQLSRLVDFGLSTTAEALGLSPWQAVVEGTAEGRLLSLDHLHEMDEQAQPALVLLDRLDGDEELPDWVRGLLVGHDLPHLSHVAIRARQRGVVMAARRDPGPLEDSLAARVGQLTALTVDNEGLHVRPASAGGGTTATRRFTLGEAACTGSPGLLALEQAESATAGGKAWGARRLAEMAADGRGGFRAPPGFVVPFGVMEACLARAPHAADEMRSLLAAADRHEESGAWADAGRRLHDLVEATALPEDFQRELGQRAAGFEPLAVRSSSNAEDLKGAVGAGLFDSAIGVHPPDLSAAVRRVWASLYGRRALAACRAAAVRARDLRMSLLIQPVVAADLSLVMYTRSPFDSSGDQAYVELAVGLGETLCSASGEGSPYRVHIDRRRGTHRLATHLSFAEGLMLGADGELRWRAVRHDDLRFGRDPAWRQGLVERLLDAALTLERELGGPQDVEGAIVHDDLWLVQSRPAIPTAEEVT